MFVLHRRQIWWVVTSISSNNPWAHANICNPLTRPPLSSLYLIMCIFMSLLGWLCLTVRAATQCLHHGADGAYAARCRWYYSFAGTIGVFTDCGPPFVVLPWFSKCFATLLFQFFLFVFQFIPNIVLRPRASLFESCSRSRDHRATPSQNTTVATA